MFSESEYESPNICPEAVVHCLGKPRLFISCSCLIAPLRGYVNRHCGEPGYSFQTLAGRSLISYYAASFNMFTYRIK